VPDLGELLDPLRHPAAGPPPVEYIAARARRHARRRRARTGAGVVAVVAVAVPVLRLRPLDVPITVGAPGPIGTGTMVPAAPGGSVPPSSSPGRTRTSAGPTTTAPLDTTVDPRLLTDDPPWAAPALAAADVPVNVAAWRAEARARAACPLLAPDDLGVGAGASPRATTRGQPGAWWVAYDLPGAPGEANIQDPTADAGLETFSVSAVDYPGGVGTWAKQVHYADGSAIGYGPMGKGDLRLRPDVPQPYLAYLNVAGSKCLYMVNTYLGEDHLLHLLQHLRRVTGAP
jgi:hypothetical protein